MKKTKLLFTAALMLFTTACSAAVKVKAPETVFNASNAIVDSGLKQ